MATKSIVVVGFGPGISRAVAERFGAEGYAVTLISRHADRLAEGVAALAASGVAAGSVVADAGDPAAITEALASARAAFGPIGVLHWNAFDTGETGDLLDLDPALARAVFDVAVVGLLAAVREALPDLRSAGDGAILVTNGAFGMAVPAMDALAVSFGAMGVALANAAKHKLVGLLAERLKGDGVFVGEVMVAGGVKGTPTAANGAIEPAAIAERFWRLYHNREDIRALVS